MTELRSRLRVSDTQLAFIAGAAKYEAFVGGVGSGKTTAGAVKAAARLQPGTLGLVVAPTYRMMRDATWRTALDVWRAHGLAEQVLRGDEMRVSFVNGAEAIFRSAEDPERLRGPNASWVWIDEAAQCHPDTWPIVIGRLREHGVAGPCWVTSTPRGMNWLYDVFVVNATPETRVYRASTASNPFLPEAFVSSLRSQYSGAFARQELDAEFVADTADALLEWAWLDQARSRPARYDPSLPVSAGVDVAGPGDAETVLCVRQADMILHLQAFADSDARGPVVAALRPWQARGLDAVNVDAAGLGHYYGLALADAGLPVVPVNVGEAPTDADAKTKYSNLRAQLFWSFRSWAAEGMLSGLTDQTTLSQLASLKYHHDSRGRIVIERKEDARKRGVRSPDRAEAVVLAFWTAPVAAPLRGVIAGAMRDSGPSPRRPERALVQQGWPAPRPERRPSLTGFKGGR